MMPLLLSFRIRSLSGLCALAIRLERLINGYAYVTLVAYAEENFHLVDTFICIETHEGPLGPD